MASFFTLAADFSPDSKRTQGIGLFGISGHLSGAIGVTLGEGVIRIGGYAALFSACAVFALISIILSFFISDPGYHLHQKSRKSFFALTRNPGLRLPFIAIMAFSISLTSYMVFLKPYAVSVGLESVTSFFCGVYLSRYRCSFNWRGMARPVRVGAGPSTIHGFDGLGYISFNPSNQSRRFDLKRDSLWNRAWLYFSDSVGHDNTTRNFYGSRRFDDPIYNGI